MPASHLRKTFWYEPNAVVAVPKISKYNFLYSFNFHPINYEGRIGE